MNTKQRPNCLANRYLREREQNRPFPSVQPYHQNNPGELIFADGSKLVTQVGSDEPEVIPPDPFQLKSAELSAYNLGVSHRLTKGKFHPNFRKDSRRHIPLIKTSYAKGWWSTPNWPKPLYSKSI